MSAPKPPRADLESPFLDEEIFKGEESSEAGAEPRDEASSSDESQLVPARHAEDEAAEEPEEDSLLDEQEDDVTEECEDELESGEEESAAGESQEPLEETGDDEFADEQGEITFIGNVSGEGDNEVGVAAGEASGPDVPVAAGGRVQARILWPALGFPAVIAPTAGSRQAASLLVDATRCVTVLVLCDRPTLSKAEAARYLRVVPWKERGRRHLPSGGPGSFREEDLVVRSDGKTSTLQFPAPDSGNQVIAFGGAGDSHAVVVHLSPFVRDLYTKAGLRFLHEIRLSEEASARLAGTDDVSRYHLLWNNQRAGEGVPSNEMSLLLQAARASRAKDGQVWVESAQGPALRAEAARKWSAMLPRLLKEYEFEYGEMHASDQHEPRRRAEVLHPLFVWKSPPRPLRIAHVTDLHVDVRWDVFEQRLALKAPTVRFNNCNRSSAAVYEDAQAANIVLMTGDLIDYGRGHLGLSAPGTLGQNKYYHRDRNWFLFLDFLASGERYTRPVYTSLGNHDWRLNPYPPFAPGAPDAREIIHDFAAYSESQLKNFVKEAHGDGADAKYSYDPRWKSLRAQDYLKVLVKAITSSETLEDKGLPTETHVDSVGWYLLTINPFLDYRCVLPGGYQLLMLDFAKQEALLAHHTRLGQNYSYVNPESGQSRGPRALACLTRTQQWMFKQFTQLPGKAKVIGMHTPPLGPYPDWGEDDLIRGFKTYGKPLEARGPLTYRYQPAGGGAALKGHPLFAIRPSGAPYGMDAEYGSFNTARETFIKELAKPAAGVQLVFTGHIHRNDLLAVLTPGDAGKANLKGQYLVKSLTRSVPTGGLHQTRNYAQKVVDPRRIQDARPPLYVNTTSAGPLGNARATENADEKQRLTPPGYTYVELSPSGVIEKVAQRFPLKPIGQRRVAAESVG